MASVMIVDDSLLTRALLKDILTSLGHSVIGEAADGVEAIDMYMEMGPDLVTMDIHMPNLDGIAALRRILELDPTARIIVASAFGQPDTIKEAISLGAKDFIIKPLDVDRVTQAVSHALKA